LIIEAVKAREILDLRGNPTVEVDVQLSGGARAVAANMGQIKSGSGPDGQVQEASKDQRGAATAVFRGAKVFYSLGEV
jgi:enolase